MKVVATHADLVNAFNEFEEEYHRLYAQVRVAAHQYLNTEAPCDELVAALAPLLLGALKEYGATATRNAPGLAETTAAEQLLRDEELHDDLKFLANLDFRRLSQGAATGGYAQEVQKRFNRALVAMETLVLPQDETEITSVYPQKALMLLTGCTPALDSNVRLGIGVAGVKGYSVAPGRPSELKGKGALKMQSFLVMMGNCWNQDTEILTKAARESRFCNDLGPTGQVDVGRLFDVLLFQQGKAKAKAAKAAVKAKAGGEGIVVNVKPVKVPKLLG
jgi:hypothetical protein